MKTMLYRLSCDGFNAHYQSYHTNLFNENIKNFKKNLNTYPAHLKFYIEKDFQNIMPNWQNFSSGVFTFVGVFPDENTIRFLTNHLKAKDEYKWFSGEINTNTYAFESHNLWKISGFKSISQLIEKNCLEVYIPEQFLKVENIKKLS